MVHIRGRKSCKTVKRKNPATNRMVKRRICTKGGVVISDQPARRSGGKLKCKRKCPKGTSRVCRGKRRKNGVCSKYVCSRRSR